MADEGKPLRLNINLTKADRERLDRLVDMTEAETTTEVVKLSLRVMEYLQIRMAHGGRLMVEDPDGSRSQVVLLGMNVAA